MLTINGNNVNDIFPRGLKLLNEEGVFRPSRNGPTIEIMEPISVRYNYPDERVLFEPLRDSNPFFSLFESLWMLAGRSDVAFLDQYNSQMKQYSDDGKRFNAAYGQRLRSAFGIDQLEAVIQRLRKNPDDRQAVLQIWDVNDLEKETKDRACNLVITPRIRKGKLDWTVFNRSNDYIYGMLGANAVHMSVIQEYVARMVGVPMGSYEQISNCMHVYTKLTPHWERLKDLPLETNCPYKSAKVTPFPLITNKESWMSDLYTWMDQPWSGVQYVDPFFEHVTKPMAIAHKAHKDNNNGLKYIGAIKASDWRLACEQWLAKRENHVD
jgi:thymidylate synthase